MKINLSETMGTKRLGNVLGILSLLYILTDIGESASPPTLPSKKLKQQTLSVSRQNAEICQNHAPGEFVANPDDCRLFYYCTENNEAVIAACPPAMLFNAEIKNCDVPSNVNCQIGTTTSERPPSTTVRPPNVVNENDEATRLCSSLPPAQEVNRIRFVGSSTSCQRYYICYYGQALLQECSANLHWNTNTGKCDLPLNAGCRLQENISNNNGNSNGNGGQLNGNGNGAGNGNGNGNTNNNNNNGSNNGSGNGVNDQFINCPNYGQHIFPHMGRCDFFIYCVKGHAALQQCPFYYHFDVVSKSCKWRTTAVCVRDLNINFQKLATV